MKFSKIKKAIIASVIAASAVSANAQSLLEMKPVKVFKDISFIKNGFAIRKAEEWNNFYMLLHTAEQNDNIFFNLILEGDDVCSSAKEIDAPSYKVTKTVNGTDIQFQSDCIKWGERVYYPITQAGSDFIFNILWTKSKMVVDDSTFHINGALDAARYLQKNPQKDAI